MVRRKREVGSVLVALTLALSMATACEDEEGPPPATPAQWGPSGVPADPGEPVQAGPVAPPPGAPQPVGGPWDAPFPEEADRAGIRTAVVDLELTVSAEGAVEAASIEHDPGHGFGEAARSYALSRQFAPAHDASGAPVRAATKIRVRFRR